jgi:hypothetical protein
LCLLFHGRLAAFKIFTKVRFTCLYFVVEF